MRGAIIWNVYPGLANGLCNAVQRNTSIPIPKILDWSDDATNCVGSEYIVMEYVAGVHLHQKWPYMSGDQKVKCIDAIYRKLKEVADINFPAYGSLYFSTSSLGSFATLLIEGGFCLGPHCGIRYWNCGDSRYYKHGIPNYGPCEHILTSLLKKMRAKTLDIGLTISAFADGLVDAGLSRIPQRDSLLLNRPSYYGSVQSHLELLVHGRTVLYAMSADGRVHDAAVPTLFYPDLYKRNIFVSDDDPWIIIGIVDWQLSSIELAFWYADEIPDFATCLSSSESSAPSVDNDDLCTKAYEICT